MLKQLKNEDPQGLAELLIVTMLYEYCGRFLVVANS